MTEELEINPVAFEDLANLENEFDEVDVQIMRKQYELQKDLYVKRKEVIERIPNFWSLVFEQAPPEIDQFVQTEDSRIFAENLKSIDVSRPELDKDPQNGNPRSLRITFTFSPNDDFEDTQLTKEFWYRRSKDNWLGLVSEPVPIKWKKGKDLTHGLVDMAVKLFEARKKTGNMQNKGLPEYTKLKKEVETWNARNTSFFTFFGWVSDHRYVSAEESSEADAAFKTMQQKRKAGEDVEEPEDLDMDDEDDDEVEAMDEGEDLAVSIADELFPDAIKYFTQAHEMEDLSEGSFEDDDFSDEDGPVDIRSLVQKDDAPPAKRQKK